MAALLAVAGVGAARVTHAAPGAAAAAPANNPKAAARKKLVEGADLLKKRDFQAALERFQAAYELLPSPKIQYNLGLAYMGLGRNADALAAFHTFLSESDDASSDTITSARKYKEALVQKIFRLTVSADVEGASIGVDGRAFGTTPRIDEIILDAGAHAVVVEKPGVGKPFTTRFDAAPGGSIHIEAKLLPPKPVRSNRLIMEAARTDAADAAARANKAPAGVVTTSSESTTSGSGRRAARIAAYASGGLALVALGFGTFEWVTKEQKYSSFNDHCGKSAVDLGGGDCRSLLNDGDRAKSLGYVGFAAAGAFGVASTLLFVLTGREHAGAVSETALACAPSLTAPGGICRLRF